MRPRQTKVDAMERGFFNRRGNENKDYTVSSKDPGLHILQRWERSIMQAKTLTHDVESVCNFTNTKLAKKKRQLDIGNDLERKVDEENR